MRQSSKIRWLRLTIRRTERKRRATRARRTRKGKQKLVTRPIPTTLKRARARRRRLPNEHTAPDAHASGPTPGSSRSRTVLARSQRGFGRHSQCTVAHGSATRRRRGPTESRPARRQWRRTEFGTDGRLRRRRAGSLRLAARGSRGPLGACVGARNIVANKSHLVCEAR
jgi:hypothetical protein